ncbi:MAG: VOC family protein [Acidobacteriota bacterium]|nr:VOC family protein [Acidobacteriota bacterium]
MATQVKPIPDGFQTVTLYLIADDAAKQIDFLTRAFDAKEDHRSTLPDGSVIHAELQVGTSRIMLGQANQAWGSRRSTVYLYVPDADETFRRAVSAGAKPLSEPQDQFYGDRSGGVEDPCGNYWWIATHVEDVSHEESDRRFAAMGHKH